MNGIVININPVLLKIGHFELHWYSLAVVVAILAAVLISARAIKKKGIPLEEFHAGILWVILGGIIGARIFHVIDHWGHYMSNPALIPGFSGLSIYGALAGGAVATIIYTRIRRISLARVADALVPGLLVGQMIGRLGCIINGDAYGGITGLPWAFIYTHPNAMIPSDLYGLPTHPYPVYEILWNGMALLFIWQLGRRFNKDGVVFLSYLSIYSAGRFILSFVRQENIWLWGLQQAQVIALLVAVTSLAAIVHLLVKQRTQVSPGYEQG